MHTEALSEAQHELLEGLKNVEQVAGFYLAGGTALALRYGHRRSIDFDFFRTNRFDERQLLSELDRQYGPVERLSSGDQTTYVRINGVTVSFFQSPYPLIKSVDDTPWNFGLASSPDLAAMKLEAIAGRGSRKDFIDLYWLCKVELTMTDVLRYFELKYPAERAETYHRLRALAYFDDAELEPMPDMIEPLVSGDVRGFFTREATRLLRLAIDPE